VSETGISDLFKDGKAPDALRTIGEVAKAFGIKQHILRYWEQQFPMLEPLKRSGGRRYYRAEDIALVADIDRLINREGYTLKGAKKALKGSKKNKKAPKMQSSDDYVLVKLKDLRERLAGALAT
jgi:DNA-binding transcriptional MerR regulator